MHLVGLFIELVTMHGTYNVELVLSFHVLESLAGLQSVRLNESVWLDVLYVAYTGVLIAAVNREVDESRNTSLLEDQVLYNML